MNTILLEPTDVLFFRDGRPMGGASAGHGAAWPLPTVINAAFHAALHRAEFAGVHEHRRGRSGSYEETRDRKFGSLVTAGPFPVHGADQWFFPRPADAAAPQSSAVTLTPTNSLGHSSLPAPLRFPVGSTTPPSKEKTAAWWRSSAWQAYLEGRNLTEDSHFLADADFADTESTYGIGMDSETGTVAESQFYSAHYLRLRDGWNLGVFATAPDKNYHHADHGNDLVRALLNGHSAEIIAGGQQRVCTATLAPTATTQLPLPLGRTEDFPQHNGKFLVKWVLLTPAIFPRIGDHPGGSLPSWVNHKTGKVELLDGPGKNAAARRKVPAGKPIAAHLVAALVGKPIPVTGYAIGTPDAESQISDFKSQISNLKFQITSGAKPTHLAVAAGSVYYFECDSPTAAQSLAAALNWHGSEISNLKSQISNRRSTLFGEKGFGLGVCGTWDFHNANRST